LEAYANRITSESESIATERNQQMKDWFFRIASRGNLRSQEAPYLAREILAKLKIQLGEVHVQQRNREKPGENKEEAESKSQGKGNSREERAQERKDDGIEDGTRRES
jgi:hypothetical protein